MTDEEVLNKIFTSGDTNNNYIDMSGGEISSAQLIEPTLALKEMNILETQHKRPNMYPERLSFRLPLVTINNYTIPQSNFVNFYVDYSSFLPTMMVEFHDMENTFLSTAFPKEGSIIQIYIGGNGDEMYYKPIRQDFIITSITRTGNAGLQAFGGVLKYRITGTLSVPAGSRRESWCDTKCSARQALFNLSVYTGLGFATNFAKDNNFDTMTWNNEQNRTLLDFMKNITNHAFYSQYSFFTSFIDQYYVLNFIECHSLLSHGGQKTDTPAMIYANTQQQTRPENEQAEGETKKTENEIVLNEGYDDLFNTEQKVSYYFLTNNESFSGWSNFIELYSEINNGMSTLNDGYRVHLSYTDSNSGGWGCNNCEFVLAPIDNLRREGPGQQISEIQEEPDQTSYIPLNLSQTTNSVYLETDLYSPDNIAAMESFVSYGEVDTSNTFKHYYFAKAQNDYQMRCMKKCGLHVRLQNYNPSITKFSRIWVDIFDKNPLSSSKIKPMEINKNWNENYAYEMKDRNDNILFFETEDENGKKLNEYGDKKDSLRGVFNRALSGWYVVTEMKIIYNKKKFNLQTDLILNRIEYKPNLKSEYELAKKSINEKYRYDNTMGSWFNSKDDSGGSNGSGNGSGKSSGKSSENNSGFFSSLKSFFSGGSSSSNNTNNQTNGTTNGNSTHTSDYYVDESNNTINSNKKVDEIGYDFIKKHEGFRDVAYTDSKGVWTIGYGSTYYTNGTKVKQGDTITQEDANRLFKYKVDNDFAKAVRNYVKKELTQNQFNALVSFAYNVGKGNLENSTLLKKVNTNPNDETIRDEFAKWNKSGGEVLAGLTKRRKEEADMYFS